jgi:ABC-type lipoprotein export system ATPase subunit
MFITCRNVYKIYKTDHVEVVALRGIDLSIERGAMVALVGASGSGKSTLLKILAGLDVPSAGDVHVGDTAPGEMNERQRIDYRRRVGVVWQQVGRNILPYLNARQNVELPMALAGLSRTEQRNRADELLKRVHLGDRMTHRPSELSGGQQQRLAIAIALANQPDILIADEPTGQVDAEVTKGILQTLHHVNRAYNITTILATHDPDVTADFERVIHMRDGRFIHEVQRSQDDATLHESTPVDSGGLVQLPPDLLASHGIQQRVTVRDAGDHIAIYPDAQSRDEE